MLLAELPPDCPGGAEVEGMARTESEAHVEDFELCYCGRPLSCRCVFALRSAAAQQFPDGNLDGKCTYQRKQRLRGVKTVTHPPVQLRSSRPELLPSVQWTYATYLPTAH
ncbi:unnamed protein product [Calypogeia fissa]